MTRVDQYKKFIYVFSILGFYFGTLEIAYGEGIFTGTITPFIAAKFTQATFTPETPDTFTQANFTSEIATQGIFPSTLIHWTPNNRTFDGPIITDFTLQDFLKEKNILTSQSEFQSGDSFTYTPGVISQAQFTPATYIPGSHATFIPAQFTPNTDVTPASFIPATFNPGTPGTFIPATFIPATLNPGAVTQPTTNINDVPKTEAALTQASFTQATFVPGTQAQFAQATFSPGNQGTPAVLLTPGQRFALENLGQLCAQDNSIACSLSSGINGITAQNLSPQAGIQAETIAITSPYQFIRNMNDRMQRLMADRALAISLGSYDPVKRTSFLMRSTASLSGSSPSFNTYGFIGPFGVSLSGNGSFGGINTADGQTGFQLNTRQANLMIDYSLNQKWIGGFSFEYLGADRDLKLSSGSLNSDSYRFAPFLLYRPNANSYLNVTGGYALANYHSTRSVARSNDIIFNEATAKYDADQYFASAGGGYTFNILNGWNLRGYGRGDFSQIDIKSFKEKGGEALDGINSLSLAMQVGEQNIRSVTSTLGSELSHAISTRTFIPVIIPRIRAEWVHEFQNDSRIIKAGFIDQNGFNTSFGFMNVAGPERNWANLGAGVQMQFSRGIVGYINYDRLIMQHVNNNTISGSVRMSF